MKKKNKALGVIAEFKEFISRGNVVDMAIGIIMGTAFTKIVNSLVNEVVMPAVGYMIGGIEFAQFKIVLAPATETTTESAILYGSFIQNVINFLLIALVVFMMVKIINRFRRKEEVPTATPAESAPTKEETLLTEIRDLLQKKKSTD